MRRASLTFACALLAVLVSGLSIASAQVVLQENWEAGTGGQLITDPPFGFEGYFGANFANISSTPLHAGWSDKALSTGAPPATSFTWNADGVGDWATPNNWNFDNRAFSAPNPNIRANNPNHTAIFDNVISTPTTVVTNAAVTVNRIEFNNTTNGYVVAGHGSVNLASTTAMIPVAPTVSVMGTRSRQSLHWQITRFE